MIIIILYNLILTDEEGPIGKYEQGSIRYTGKNIPSPSFRVLQRLAKCDDEDQAGNYYI